MEALKTTTTKFSATSAITNRRVVVANKSGEQSLAEMGPTEIEEILASLDGRNLRGHVRLRNQVERGLKQSQEEVTRLTALAQRLEAELAQCHQELGQAKQNLKGYRRLERAFAVLDALTVEDDDDQDESAGKMGSIYRSTREVRSLPAQPTQPVRELVAPNVATPLRLPAPRPDSLPGSSNDRGSSYGATIPSQTVTCRSQLATATFQDQAQDEQSGKNAELIKALGGLGRRLARGDINLSGFERLCRQTLSQYGWGYNRLKQAEEKLNQQARLLSKKKPDLTGFESRVRQILEESGGN